MKYVRLHLDEHVSVRQIEREHGIRNSLVLEWGKRYLQDEEESLEPRNGNHYAALYRSKSLSEVGRLRAVGSKARSRDHPVKKKVLGGRGWCKQGIRYWLRKDYEVLEELKVKYPVDFLRKVMGINRSGYYKWKAGQGKLNR